MTVTAVVGAQWGDEGKGRIIDFLAKQANYVIRFQGGDNAGHTVVNDFGKPYFISFPAESSTPTSTTLSVPAAS